MKGGLHGVVAEFLEPEEVLAAARQAYGAGYRRLDAYTPFAVEDLDQALGQRTSAVALITLLCGITGGCTGFGMEYYAAVFDYPINVGGRPLDSWPMFIPITFELTILFAALGALIGMLAINGLPHPHHPIFDTPFFATRSHSRFYLCIEAADARFDLEEVRGFLAQQHPVELWEVPA